MKDLTRKVYKVIPVRGIVCFPNMPISCDIGKNISKSAIQEAFALKEQIVIVKDITTQNNNLNLNEIGCLANIKKCTVNNNGTLKLLAECTERVRLVDRIEGEQFLTYVVEEVPLLNVDTNMTKALLVKAKERFFDYSGIDNRIRADLINLLNNVEDANVFIDSIASIIVKKEENQLVLLNEFDTEKRLELLIGYINEEIEIMTINQKISEKVRNSMDKNQKDYYLREQMKAISDELGDGEDDFKELEKKIEKASLPKEVHEKALKELARLRKLPSQAPDYGILRNYLDVVTELPWNNKTEDNKDLKLARQILDEDHSGLEKVKTRIIEYLAVMQLTDKLNGQIICFVGPPGVGKTSIARSIARALNRNFVQMSVGGLKDESEIRGHRKTYVGAMPGRIIYNMNQAKSVNPVFLIDEIDKMASDYKGDPASAMLEVLDPEQNFAFRDNFLEVPYDLSNVLFLATANNAQDIPPALYDRLEIIELSSYTTNEKFDIAKKYLLPKEIKKHGFKTSQLEVTDEAMKKIIEEFTFEAGVRNLERQMATICRKVAVEIVSSEDRDGVFVRVDTNNLNKYLGAHKVIKEVKRDEAEIGVVSGLSYSTLGGGVLTIEANKVAGDGKIILTGRLGDVMKESARTALSAVIGIASEYGIDQKIFKETDIHIHVPEGAVKKDGPSAGCALSTAIFSLFSGKKIDNNLAMTGEITLRGNVLAIGGLKEKLFACVRAGITKVIVPFQNKQDVEELPKDITDSLEIVYVKNLKEVLSVAILD